jgi:hemerythrin-like domain-containing protein
MPKQTKPNVAVSLFTLHKVITRALNVSIEQAQAFSQPGFPDETMRLGFFNYLRALVSVLNAHHLIEDDLAFPYFKDKLPDTPFELLTEQHQEMAAILEELQREVEGIEAEAQAAGGLEGTILALKKINDIWHPHIQIEEEHFEVDRVGEMLPEEEQLRLIKLYGEYSQKHSGPAYLTVPFTLYNLPADIREGLARAMPSEVVEQLVPIVWRDKWESMTPFLLE